MSKQFEALHAAGRRLLNLKAQQPTTWPGIGSMGKEAHSIRDFFGGKQDAFESFCKHALDLDPDWANAVMLAAGDIDRLKGIGVTPDQALMVLSSQPAFNRAVARRLR